MARQLDHVGDRLLEISNALDVTTNRFHDLTTDFSDELECAGLSAVMGDIVREYMQCTMGVAIITAELEAIKRSRTRANDDADAVEVGDDSTDDTDSSMDDSEDSETFYEPDGSHDLRLPSAIRNLPVSEHSGRSQKCSVCLSRIRDGHVIRSLPCFHTFHLRCLDEWISANQGRSTCPECRANILQQMRLCGR